MNAGKLLRTALCAPCAGLVAAALWAVVAFAASMEVGR